MENGKRANTRPFLRAMGFSFGLIALLIASQLMVVRDTAEFEAAGQAAGRLSFHIVVAGVALGIWAWLARRKWSWFGFAWRFVICVVVATFVGTFLSVLGSMPPN